MMDTKKMLLLNILDDNLKEFISKTCEDYSLPKPSLVPHITLRGPFLYNKKKPSLKVIKELNTYIEDLKKGEKKLEIDGVGMFNNNNLYIVYLNVIPNDTLKKLSYKKDYSFAKFGFNPHITIFTTTDKKKAKNMIDNLNNQNIKFSCKNLEWGLHKLKSDDKNIFNLSNFL